MHILIVNDCTIPALLYGGTERVIWYLGKELVNLGHKVSYLVRKGSHCPFADVLVLDPSLAISEQIPQHIDIVHLNAISPDVKNIKKPYVITIHRNLKSYSENILDANAIFVSKNHAQRYGSDCYVHNGLDWDDYLPYNELQKKDYFHFLGKAAWRVKNVQGAIDTVKHTKQEKLKVLGGNRFNFKMGMRLTLSPRVKFYGMVGGEKKAALLQHSKGLIFPVKWHEPFGLAITESLYYGCPVFGTPNGSLPELVSQEFGFLSNEREELSRAIENSNSYSSKQCHDYAVEEYNSKKMALSYLDKYEKVLTKETLNTKMPTRDFSIKESSPEWKS